jgi:hypothetical protein
MEWLLPVPRSDTGRAHCLSTLVLAHTGMHTQLHRCVPVQRRSAGCRAGTALA